MLVVEFVRRGECGCLGVDVPCSRKFIFPLVG